MRRPHFELFAGFRLSVGHPAAAAATAGGDWSVGCNRGRRAVRRRRRQSCVERARLDGRRRRLVVWRGGGRASVRSSVRPTARRRPLFADAANGRTGERTRDRRQTRRAPAVQPSPSHRPPGRRSCKRTRGCPFRLVARCPKTSTFSQRAGERRLTTTRSLRRVKC